MKMQAPCLWPGGLNKISGGWDPVAHIFRNTACGFHTLDSGFEERWFSQCVSRSVTHSSCNNTTAW